MVEQGTFRKDLYFRLNVVNLRIPPLRNRREDIAALAMHFLERMETESGVKRTFSDSTLRVMTEYDWPGNVRELENAIERACALSSGPVLHMGDLPTQLQNFRLQQGPGFVGEDEPERGRGVRRRGWRDCVDCGDGEACDSGDDPAVEGRQADGGEAAGDWEDDALPEAEGVWDFGGDGRVAAEAMSMGE